LWWLLPIVLLAVTLVYGQYYYKNPYKKDLSFIRTSALAALRALVYIGLLFLLLNPRIKYSQQHIEKPLLIWAQDNSQSVRFCKDSTYFLNDYSKDVDAFLQKLSSKYEVQKLSFGQDVRTVDDFDFSDLSSDYASLFGYLKNNTQAPGQTQVILSGDGLYNKGNDPRFSIQEIQSPVHSLSLGDAATQKDLSIVSLRSNKLAFLKSNTPVRVGLKADFCSGDKLIMKLTSGFDILYKDTIAITSDAFFVEKDFFISPDKVGLQKYQLRVQPLEGEYSLKNNVRDIVVDVLDSKRKIAICYDTYHPDIAALHSALSDQGNFSVDLIDISKKQVEFSDFNLIILYQLPSIKQEDASFFSRLKGSRLPFMMILGGGSDFDALNQFDLGLNVIRSNELYQDARMEFEAGFSLFEMDQQVKNSLADFPPLMSPMASYQMNQESNVMGTQLIKGISTDVSLVVFSQKDEQKQAYILGEGLWRWKLHDYKMNNSHEHFNTLISQMVQYLALRVKKNQLSLQYDKVYKESDEIRIEAQLYNKSYQATNQAEIKFLLQNESGEEFAYQFERLGQVYGLDLNRLPAGNYQFVAKVNAFDQDLESRGAFLISADNLEAKNLQANPNLLKQLSDLSEGLHFPVSKLSQLSDSLMMNNKVRAQISLENNYSSTLNIIWILCLVIMLLVLEWFLRKYWLGI